MKNLNLSRIKDYMIKKIKCKKYSCIVNGINMYNVVYFIFIK